MDDKNLNIDKDKNLKINEDNQGTEIKDFEETKFLEDFKLQSEAFLNSSLNEDKTDMLESDNNLTENKVIEEKKVLRKKKKKKKGHSLAGGLVLMTVIIAVSCAIAMTVIVFAKDMLGFGGIDASQDINIPQGSSASQISEILKEKEIIKYPKVFLAYCKFNNSGSNFYPGVHILSDSMTYGEIINELEVNVELKESVKVTFKEGTTIYDAASILEINKICKAADFIWAFNHTTTDADYEWVKTLIATDNNLKFCKMEGYCFPDTYEFFPNSKPETVVKKIRDNFNDKVYTKYSAKMKEAGLDLDKAITLASVVQNEAGQISEMKKVSSVFFNRLNNSAKFPLLQSDPTKKYVANVIKPNIQIENKAMYAAYDTYQGKGLPPGAISSPGIDAIEAVLNPEKTDYFYFCSNINTKEFFYAKTLVEHSKNLKKAGLK